MAHTDKTDHQIEEFTQGLSKVRLIRCSMKYSHLQVYIYFRNFSPKRGHTITYRLEMCSYNYCVIHLFIKAFQIALIDNCVSNDIYLAMLRIWVFFSEIIVFITHMTIYLVFHEIFVLWVLNLFILDKCYIMPEATWKKCTKESCTCSKLIFWYKLYWNLLWKLAYLHSVSLTYKTS